MLRDRRARGLRAPALDRKPELKEHLVWVWNAFQQLSSCRQLGMAVGPIPWLAIDAYAIRHRICDEDDFEDFRYMIMAMDNTYMDHMAKRRPPTVPQGAAPQEGRK